MGSDDTGVGRLDADTDFISTENGGAAPTVIRADIAWRGPDVRRRIAPKLGVKPAVQKPSRSTIIGSSAAAAAMREKIDLYAEYDAPVLITGETGTGKELIATELHERSARRGKAFIPVNAGAVPETLAAAEFFGHTKGAFTSAVAEREGALVAADGGTLFLDEIGDMPLSIQAQFLRVLDDGLVPKIGSRAPVRSDFRLIAATNVDIEAAAGRGEFRSDLLYRINALTIEAPPLRERGDDIVEIAEHYIGTFRDPRLSRAVLTPAAADALKAHPFPGNVRELRNVLQRALVHSAGGKILPEHFALGRAAPASGAPAAADEVKELAARFVVFKALRAAKGDVPAAVKSCGRSKSAIYGVLKEDGIEASDAEKIEQEFARLRAQLRAVVEN